MQPPEKLKIDTAASTAAYGSRSAKLNRRELALLLALRDAHGHYTASHELRRIVWGEYSEIPNLRMAIMALRRKLELEPDLPRLIESERGMGYRLNPTAYIP